ncbi:MAG TPA: hypothetical protein VF128_16125 [Gemmatimonadaceae bacterium]
MRSKRVQTVQRRLNRFPYKYEAIDDAYVDFLADGTLPEDNALAWRVLKRVLHARKPLPPHPDDLAQVANRPLYQPHGTTREMLFNEACCGFEPARNLARFLLKAVVQGGYDPTDSELIGPEMERMDFASIGMQLLHFPQDYVRPQYAGQMQRVLRQQAEVRAQRPMGDDEWDRGAGAALRAFSMHGQVPTESRYFLYVLSTFEMFALVGHYFGKLGEGGEELLASYEAVASGNDEERAAALQRLGPLQVQTKVRE